MKREFMEILDIRAREILDSRGNPTVEVEIEGADASFGKACVPSGASTGEHEALELRDGDQERYHGRGVQKAIQNIEKIIKPKLLGRNLYAQTENDLFLISLDKTPNKEKLGANAILGVSLALAHTAAVSLELPLYRYLGGAFANILPVPLMNLLNGGQHANNNLDFQEFMIVPHNFSNFSDALRAGVEVFHSLQKILTNRSLSTAVGDEGGFAPNLKSNEEALDLLLEAIEKTSYQVDTQISLALDVASSEFYNKKEKLYTLGNNNEKLDTSELIALYEKLCHTYPIISIEDGIDQNDWIGWSILTKKLGHKVQLVGDDLLVSNPKILERAISEKVANSILVKLNQIGSVSEAFQATQIAQKAGYTSIISHRSGETEDTSIAHFAVATHAGQIKTGSLSRTDRLAKYNELLRIADNLSNTSQYIGSKAFPCLANK